MSSTERAGWVGDRTDLTRYGYSRIDTREPRRLPGGKAVALWIATNHEFYELSPPERPSRPGWPRVRSDVLNYSWRDYGNRVAVWRLFDIAAALGLKLSVSQNVAMIDHHPEIAEECVGRGWEIFAHGVYNTRYMCDLDEAEERAVIEDCVATIERVAGKPPAGWLGPALSNTPRTLDLLAEYGFTYTCDFFHDDQPTELRVEQGRLVSVPYTLDLNDFTAFVGRSATPEEYAASLVDQLEELSREAEDSGSYRVMCVALHPYLVNQPHRQTALVECLEALTSREGVWLTTGAEIADWFLAGAGGDDGGRGTSPADRGHR
ncbi:MAG TPA: polysaccharide deacetylase family protein [Acidimicrobiales bacterium]|nr:polysaccharide deacetylase family protein [Acidimicrobiales bacterium]